MIPEARLFYIINYLLDFCRKDYLKNQSTPENSFLYRILQGEKMDKFDFYTQSVDLIVKRFGTPQQIQVSLMYNPTRMSLPCIHIITPEDRTAPGFIGNGSGDYPDEVNKQLQTVNESFSVPFACTYIILVTSPSVGESTLLYHLLKCLFVSGYELFELNEMINYKVSGSDITLQTDLIPPDIFHKMLRIDFTYFLHVPSIITDKILQDFEFTLQAVENLNTDSQ